MTAGHGPCSLSASTACAKSSPPSIPTKYSFSSPNSGPQNGLSTHGNLSLSKRGRIRWRSGDIQFEFVNEDRQIAQHIRGNGSSSSSFSSCSPPISVCSTTWDPEPFSRPMIAADFPSGRACQMFNARGASSGESTVTTRCAPQLFSSPIATAMGMTPVRIAA